MIRKRKRNYFYGLAAAFGVTILALFCGAPKNTAEAAAKATPTPNPNRRLSTITAVYTGNTELVGHAIDVTKLTVMGLYSDGSYETIKGFTLSKYTITNTGPNEIIVSYGSVSTKISIQGKKVISLNAYNKSGDKTVGEQLEKSDLVVRAVYSDGSSEEIENYTLLGKVVTNVGSNIFYVSYEGQTAAVTVIGKPIRRLKELQAYYTGASVIVGNAPKRTDFNVMAIYNDNTMETITDFELSPSVVQKEGENRFIVSKGGISTVVTVYGTAKEVVSIKAEYTGFPLVVGTSVANADIRVTATFNDNSKDTVTNFSIINPVIYQVGDNVITVTCGRASASFPVRGVEAEVVNYDKGPEALLRDGGLTARVNIAVNEKADKNGISIQKISDQLVKKAMRRIVNTDKFFAMEITFDDPELALFLPMTVKVTVPAGYDRDNFGVFYSPNRRTIMAQMNGTFLKDGSYEFKMFQPGTYILADCTKRIYVEEIVVEKDEIALKNGKSYSLKPVIYPFDATNKEVDYASSNPKIATVNEDGLITATGTGRAMIAVTAKDGGAAVTYVVVEVKK